MCKLVNLTPHIIRYIDADSVTKELYPSGVEARVTSTQEVVGQIDSTPIYEVKWGEVVGIPPCEDGVFYIVSAIVASRAMRFDVFSPDTGATAIRKDGQVYAVRGFIFY